MALRGPMELNEDPNGVLAGFRRAQGRRGLTRATIDGRDRSLRLFFHWLGRCLLTATPKDVDNFLDQRDLGARARYKYLSDFHCFYQWTMRQEIPGAQDPTLRIDRPKLHAGLPRPIGDDDLDMALRMADTRMRAMLLTAHLAGARCIEIARLEREDVCDTYDPPVILLHGKGDKDRVVPLHDELATALRVLPMPRAGRVFRSPTGRPLTANGVSWEICQYLHTLGISDTAHSLRHWFGTHFYAATKDLRVTQEMMGHASPTTTAIYTRWSVSDAVDGVRRLSSPSGERRGEVRGERRGELRGRLDLDGHDVTHLAVHRSGVEDDELEGEQLRWDLLAVGEPPQPRADPEGGGIDVVPSVVPQENRRDA